ncbi:MULTISPECIES: hypothetical protein [Clostridia]|nr:MULTISPECIES: hypothetical protein [Eubacteriales]MEA4962614.1 hypothetical protein [Lutispora sp.]
MDQELKQQLEFMNNNLNAIVTNQAMIYCKLKDMEDRIPEEEEKE